MHSGTGSAVTEPLRRRPDWFSLCAPLACYRAQPAKGNHTLQFASQR